MIVSIARCDVHSKKGRPKRQYSSGCPSFLTCHLCSIASVFPPFSLDQLVDPSYKESITCIICQNTLEHPVETLPCKWFVVTVYWNVFMSRMR